MVAVIGWDIGGAHLKAARIEAGGSGAGGSGAGRVVAARQIPAPLWLGLDRLEAAIAEMRRDLGPARRHGVTMTGELADIFPERGEGVRRLAALMTAALAPAPVAFYAGREGFVADVAGREGAIASANWHASAALAASAHPAALFADCGSTTTDLIPISGGEIVACGTGDAERLAAGELVYTGLTRSFVMALADRVPFAGIWTPLACEHFATSADLYRILGELDEADDQMPAADGREKTPAASIARLARMLGRDAGEASPAAWRDLAGFLAEAQLRRIHDAALLVLSRCPLPADAPVIAAGVGAALMRRLAARLGRRCQPLFTDRAAATHAPAAAIGVLLSRTEDRS